MNRLAQAAAAYAEQGWPVLPIVPRGKPPAGWLVPRGLHDATTDLATIRAWWSQTPDANVGLRTGDRCLVIDCDGPDGVHALEQAGARAAAVGAAVATTGRGEHWYFAAPASPIGNRAGILEHVDVRGVGGYVAAPPSIHATGRFYRWKNGRPPGELAPLPQCLRDLLIAPEPVLVPRRVFPRPEPADTYAAAAVRRETDGVAAAAAGVRNDTLNRAAFNLGTLVGAGALSAEQVAEELLEAARACGLPEREAVTTITSGLRAGVNRPRRRP